MSKAAKILKIIVLLCLAGPIWAQQSAPLDQSLPLDTLFKDPLIQGRTDSLARDTTVHVKKDSIPDIEMAEHSDSLPHHTQHHKVVDHSLPLHIFSDAPEQMRKFRLARNVTDSLQAYAELNKAIIELHKKAFLEANIDSVRRSSKSWNGYLTVGQGYKWVKLSPGNLERVSLNRIGYSQKYFADRPFSYSEVASLEEKLIVYLENIGYPFASVRLDSMHFADRSLSATLMFEKGPYITIDTITVAGITKTKQNFFQQYLRIQKGQPFIQSKVDDVDKLIKQLPYLRLTGPTFVVFRNKKAYPVVQVEDQRANQIDGIIGFLPNSTNQKKTLITGQFNLTLYNLFGTGKNLIAAWERFQVQSQKLDLSFVYPNLLSTNLELKGDFNLLKQDTTFFNMAWGITVSTLVKGGGKVSFVTGIKSARIGSTQSLGTTTTLPSVADFDYKYGGLVYQWNSLDDFFYPKKGTRIALSGNVGQKSVKRSSAITDQTLYDSIPLSTVQYTGVLDFEQYLRIAKSTSFLFRPRAGFIQNSGNLLFVNDLFRVGGFKLLRGFNESEYYAQRYGVVTAELRQYLDPTSYLLLFVDQGYIYSDVTSTPFKEDMPLGVGGGISFTTQAGIFNFLYALGKTNNTQFNFSQSKIHFGFVSRF